MFTLIDTEKACNKVQHPFMTKTLNKVPHPFMIKALTIDTDLEGTYLNIVKSINEKPASKILNREKLRAFIYDQEQGRDIQSHHCYET